ncbi:hypothetical protein [Aliiruegeria sabulilitoris]|uniref:hypothetical protein n=1 Tax=Aliiruegeria sabulilitoris TaxID=1510458 RepID=UPI0008338424|nr:hypothetical protein [Aliiruegeria sabulilitoris]NDR55399.1 hypothetical protein [Pseudoruegeria sp. M32A2M]
MLRDLSVLGRALAVVSLCMLPNLAFAQGGNESAGGPAVKAQPVSGAAELAAQGAHVTPQNRPDPMDAFCKTLGKPAKRRDIAKLTGASIERLIDGVPVYSEVLGDLEANHPRSNRYGTDGRRSAHKVRMDGRRLCVELAEGGTADCTLPVACLSYEADYVLLSKQGAPFARVHSDGRAPQNAARGSEKEDWILHAGGSFGLRIDEKQKVSDRLLGKRGTRNNCRIGNGFAEIDSAEFFYWIGKDCNGGPIQPPGTIVHMQANGTLGHVDLRAHSGLSVKHGMIVWQFPTKPMDAQMVCEDARSGIPGSAEEVATIRILVKHPPKVAVGEPAVFEKIVVDLLPYVERICGVAGAEREVRVELAEDSRDAPKPLNLVVKKGVPSRPAAFAGDHVEQERNRDFALREEAAREFRRYIVDNARRTYYTNLRETIRNDRMIPNLSNAMDAYKVPTLVALTKGRSFRMPWQNPTFERGVFQVSWRVSVDNPVEDFLARKPHNLLWATIRQGLSLDQSISPTRVTCRIGESAAQRLPERSWVTVRGKLLSYDGGGLVLDCSAG